MTRIKYAIIALFLVLGLSARAQSVGLVLSGGGAKGLYHIGVIKALEENNIPIDYISGTSMGAIIGGLYAIGYTPEQMAEEFLSSKIHYWITGEIEQQYVYYFKRMRKNASMVNLRLDFNKLKGHRMPTNIVPTSQMDMAFVEFFSGATIACQGDFDKLVVPFRCVATDVTNRGGVIFKNGDIGKAVRASMSIPLVFQPIRTDSSILYDGGMFNNFPWQILDEEFKPDILIGSKCTGINASLKDNSMIDQVFSLTMLSTDFSLPKGRSIMIDRIFSDISMMDFDKAAIIIQRGYEDAMDKMEEVKSTISRRTDPQELAMRRSAFKAREPELVLDDFNVTGLNSSQTEYVHKLLGLDRSKESKYPFEKFRTEYLKLLSEGEFETDYPIMEYNDTIGYHNLTIGMKTKPSLKFKVGGNISSTALNQAYIGLEYKKMGNTAQSYYLDGYFSPFYTSVALSTRTDFFMKRPYYFEYGLSYNYYNYFRSNYGFISKGRALTYAKEQDIYGMVAFGMPIARQVVLNLRLHGGREEYRYYPHTYYAEEDPMDRTRFRFGGAKIEMERNSMANGYSIRGLRQNISAFTVGGKEYFSAADNLDQKINRKRIWGGVHFEREEYYPVEALSWFSWGYLIEGTYTNHPEFFNEYATNITSPAFKPTPHSRIVYMKEFRNASYTAIGLMPSIEFAPNFYLKCSAYTYLPAYVDGVKEGIEQRFRYIFDASMVYQTVVGPVSLSLSKYDVSRNNWFLTFNFGYSIFNKKGLFY